MRQIVITALAALVLSGCATVGIAKTLGEQSSGFGYVPLDGLAVAQALDSASCTVPAGAKPKTPSDLITDLPDISVRFSVGSFTTTGALTFGPAKLTDSGGTYRAILDYVNVDDVPVTFYLAKYVQVSQNTLELRKLSAPVTPPESVVAYDAYIDSLPATAAAGGRKFTLQAVTGLADSLARKAATQAGQYDRVTIPVYVGIGLRLSADVRALKSGIGLTSLGAIGAQADANTLVGTLTVQTIGIGGKAVATVLPLPSKLDQTTIENGILAIAGSRSVMFENSATDVTRTARVVGLYSPLKPEPALVNAIYSELSRVRPKWVRTCQPASS